MFKFKILEPFFYKNEKEKIPSKSPQEFAMQTNTICGYTFDGELEPFAYGDEIYNETDYYSTAKRAYSLVKSNEFAQIAASRLTQFVVGTGLKLHPMPAKRFLKNKFGIKLDKEFIKDIQDLWTLFEEDNNVSFDKTQNLSSLAATATYNAIIAGDVLVVKRVSDGFIKIQLINGLNVYSSNTQTETGNEIKDGVEIEKETGRHIAYYVQLQDGEEKRIEAFDRHGRPVAWLMYGANKPINSVRNYSQFCPIMQKIKKIGDYANSEVLAAETNSKFGVTIHQDKDSNGINALKNVQKGIGRHFQNTEPVPVDTGINKGEWKKFEGQVRKIPSALSFFVPKGQKMEAFDPKRPNVNYSNFVDCSMKYIYATFGVPYEVAVLSFNSNFSASRAAMKLFELITAIYRQFATIDGFYMPIYRAFFEIACLQDYIKAPKYLQLKNDNGFMDNAFTKAKFIGQRMPHIDPVKEVNAVVTKLKSGLLTFEQAIEEIGAGIDLDTIIDTRANEETKIKNKGLKFETNFIEEMELKNGNN